MSNILNVIKSSTSLKIAGKTLFTILILYFLISQIDIGDLYILLKKITKESLLVTATLYLLTYFVRAYRFKILNIKKTSIFKLILVTLVHGFYNRILPFRIGEAAYIVLMKKIYNIKYYISFNNIVIVRMYDLLINITLFILFLFYFNSFNTMIYIFFILLIIMMMAILFNLSLVFKYIYIILKKLNIANKHYFKLKKLIIFNKRKSSLNVLLKLLLSTIILWSLFIGIYYLLIINISFDIPLSKIIFANSLSNISQILPISSFGNFGTMEAGWATALVFLGIDKEVAILTGFLSNIYTFVLIFIFGLLGILAIKITSRRII